MRQAIILLTLMSVIDVAYAGDRYPHESVLSNHCCSFVEQKLSHLKFTDNKSVSRIQHQPNYVSGKHYDLMQTFGVPIIIGVAFNPRSQITKEKDSITFSHHQPPTIFYQKQNNHTKLFMVNSYYNFYNESSFVPYLSIGFGVGINLNNNQSPSDPSKKTANDSLFTLLKSSRKQFFYTFGLGSSYGIGDRWSAELGAGYLHKNSHSASDNNNKKENKTTSREAVKLVAGLTYQF